jgi:uncharacterized iron-regulated protein
MERLPIPPGHPDATVFGRPRRRGLLALGMAVLAPAGLAGCAGGPARWGADASAAPDAAGLARFDHVLLGEVHDNPEHHAARAALLRDLLADGRPTTVLFEMMGRRHDAALARAMAAVRRPVAADPAAAGAAWLEAAESVATAGGLDRRGWGWPLHRPLVEAAIAGGAGIRGANIESAEARAAVREGLGALPEDVRNALAADRAWSAGQQRVMEVLIDEGHCHQLPERLHAPMALAQRARDAAMALAMQRAVAERRGSRAVLVAGHGHVRRDVGAPHHLAALGVPVTAVAALAWLERGQPAFGFDGVVVTAALPGRPDPCEALRKR